MALNLKGKKTEKKEEKEIKYLELTSLDINRAVNNDYGVFFDMTLNGIKINGCSLKERKDNKKIFVAFPQRHGNDGKYYPIVSAYLDDDTTELIVNAVENTINNG
jgi:hypothetical protein